MYYNVEIVRAGKIHKRHAFDYLAIFIKTLCPIREIFFSYWDFFYQNWEKYILICIGTGPFMGPGYIGRKIPEWVAKDPSFHHADSED